MPGIDWQGLDLQHQSQHTQLRVIGKDLGHFSAITCQLGWWYQLQAFGDACLASQAGLNGLTYEAAGVARIVCWLSAAKVFIDVLSESGLQLYGRSLGLPSNSVNQRYYAPNYLVAIARCVLFAGIAIYAVSTRQSRQVFEVIAVPLLGLTAVADYVEVSKCLSVTGYKTHTDYSLATSFTLMGYVIATLYARFSLNRSVEVPCYMANQAIALFHFAAFKRQVRHLYAIVSEIESPGRSPYGDLRLMCSSEAFLSQLSDDLAGFLQQDGMLERVFAVFGDGDVQDGLASESCFIERGTPLIPVRISSKSGVVETAIYNLAAIARWHQADGTSPCTRAPFSLSQLNVDRGLFEEILSHAQRSQVDRNQIVHC